MNRIPINNTLSQSPCSRHGETAVCVQVSLTLSPYLARNLPPHLSSPHANVDRVGAGHWQPEGVAGFKESYSKGTEFFVTLKTCNNKCGNSNYPYCK